MWHSAFLWRITNPPHLQIMQKIKLPLWLSILLLLALTMPSHLVGLDKFATLDEPWWVISGSNYYYALTHRDFANTIYDYHPAVTTTWVRGADRFETKVSRPSPSAGVGLT